MNTSCPNCGSSKPPVNKTVWSSNDKVITVILLVLFFPAGLIYFLMKRPKDQQPVCPDCKKPYFEGQEASVRDDFSKVTNVVKNVAKDPAVRQSFRELKKDAKAFQDSFDIN